MMKKNSKSQQLSNQLSEQVIQKIINNINCSICFQILIYPYLTKCGHIFCFQCIQKVPSCPLCRQKLRQNDESFVPNQEITSFVINYVHQKMPQQKESYNQRMMTFNQNEKKRFYPIEKLFQKLRVDFKDANQKWRQGQINKLIMQGDDTLIQIKALYSQKTIIINAKSRNVTRYKTKTLNHSDNLQTQYKDQVQESFHLSQMKMAEITSSNRQFFIKLTRENYQSHCEEKARIYGLNI